MADLAASRVDAALGRALHATLAPPSAGLPPGGPFYLAALHEVRAPCA
jgi:hypothetical protein